MVFTRRKNGNIFSVVTTARVRPTLKGCSFPIHQSREKKTSHEPPAGINSLFAISLSTKIHDKKIKKDEQLMQ